ncbi:hypothetical protein JCM11957_15220 [Caminibacter profundus]
MTKQELLQIAGELTKNIGLGIFVNGVYGVSDGNIQTYELIDISLGIALMILGIIAERRAK